MAVQRSAACSDCGKTITINRDGKFRPHGHPARRCKSSGEAPPEGAETICAERLYAETYGKCSRCGDQKRLKKDGTVYRHYDARDLPVRPQQGWRPGSDQEPKPEEKPQLGMCSCCDRQVRVDRRGFPHRHLGPAGFCKGEDFKVKPKESN